MKRQLIRTFSAALCALLVFALFPLTSRADSPYVTVTKRPDKEDEYAALEMPQARYYFTRKDGTLLRSEVKPSWKNGSIYFMPHPAETYGTLGTVDEGTPVTILAQENGLYFFLTDDGRMGWNGRGFFTKPQAVEDLSAPITEGSALTGETLAAVSEALAGGRHAGAASPTFYADRPMLVMQSGSTATMTVYGFNNKATYDFERIDGESAEAEWQGEGFRNGRRNVLFTAGEPGLSVFTFRNSRNSQRFNVLILVV